MMKWSQGVVQLVVGEVVLFVMNPLKMVLKSILHREVNLGDGMME